MCRSGRARQWRYVSQCDVLHDVNDAQLDYQKLYSHFESQSNLENEDVDRLSQKRSRMFDRPLLTSIESQRSSSDLDERTKRVIMDVRHTFSMIFQFKTHLTLQIRLVTLKARISRRQSSFQIAKNFSYSNLSSQTSEPHSSFLFERDSRRRSTMRDVENEFSDDQSERYFNRRISILWQSTRRRAYRDSIATHKSILNITINLLHARIMTSEVDKKCISWSESQQAMLSQLMSEIWLDAANRLSSSSDKRDRDVKEKSKTQEVRRVRSLVEEWLYHWRDSAIWQHRWISKSHDEKG